MKQIVTNLESYIIGQIGVCGEIDYEMLQASFEDAINKKSIMNTVSKLVTEKKITKYKYSKNSLRSEKKEGGVYAPSDVTMLRLSKIDGDSALQSISDELFMHFELFAGKVDQNDKKGKRYTGNRIQTKRLENSARIMQRLFYSNINIDYCNLAFKKSKDNLERLPRPAVIKTTKDMLADGMPQTVFDVKGNKLLNMRNIIARSDRNIPMYISSKAIHSKDPGQSYHSRADMARHHGVLMTASKQYMVYFIDMPESRWSRDIEETYKTYFANIIKDGYSLKERPELGGLFFVENVDAYGKVLNSDKTLKGVYNPISVFNKDARMLPICDKNYDVSYKFLFYGLTIKGFDEALNAIIWDILKKSAGIEIEKAEGETYIAEYKGRRIYSAIDCKLGPLFDAKRDIAAGNRSIVFCNTWQREAIKQYLELSEENASKQLLVYKDNAVFEKALESINKLPK